MFVMVLKRQRKRLMGIWDENTESLCRNRRKSQVVGGVDVTAVEIDPQIAAIYKELYPDDKVIIGDAHKYLLEHFDEYDFIWSSPPCPTHSVLMMTNYHDKKYLKYPDMTLYQEIIFLKTFYRGKFVVENVKPYYKTLISPSFELNRHYFWCKEDMIFLGDMPQGVFTDIKDDIDGMENKYGFHLSEYKLEHRKRRQMLRNCVIPEIGKYIFERVAK